METAAAHTTAAKAAVETTKAGRRHDRTATPVATYLALRPSTPAPVAAAAPARAMAPARIPAAAIGLAIAANAAIDVVRSAAPAWTPTTAPAGTPIAAGRPADTKSEAEAVIVTVIIDDHRSAGRRGISGAAIGAETQPTRLPL